MAPSVVLKDGEKFEYFLFSILVVGYYQNMFSQVIEEEKKKSEEKLDIGKGTKTNKKQMERQTDKQTKERPERETKGGGDKVKMKYIIYNLQSLKDA